MKFLKCIRELEVVNFKFVFSGDFYFQIGFDISGVKFLLFNLFGNFDFFGWIVVGGLNWVGFFVIEINVFILFFYNFVYGGVIIDVVFVMLYVFIVCLFVDQVGIFIGSLGVKLWFVYVQWNVDNVFVVVWIGVNDVGNLFENQNLIIVVDLCVDRYFQLVREIYKIGVRKFVFFIVFCMFFIFYIY